MDKLLLIDDEADVQYSFRRIFDSPEVELTTAASGEEGLRLIPRIHPDLVIMDVRLPDGSGIEACREIRDELPETRVVILTSYPDEEAVFSAIIAGASGYLLKQIRGRDLVNALEAVGRGESLLDPAVTAKVLDRVRRLAAGEGADELGQLTAQERKILFLVAEGKTNKEIASEVFLSDKTVKNYVSSILSKLNLERRTQAAAFVARHRLDRGGGAGGCEDLPDAAVRSACRRGPGRAFISVDREGRPAGQFADRDDAALPHSRIASTSRRWKWCTPCSRAGE